MFMLPIDNARTSAFERKSNVAVTLADDDEGADLPAAHSRSSTHHRSKHPMDSTDNNPAVVRVEARLGRANPIIGVVNIGAAAKQKRKSHGADQRKVSLQDYAICFFSVYLATR